MSESDDHQLVACVPLALWVAAPNGEWLQANPHAAHRLGAAPGELLGFGYKRWLAPSVELHLGGDDPWQGLAQRREPFSAECRLLMAAGQPRWHRVEAAPVRAADGTIVRWCGSLVDIEAQKALEAELVRSRERHQSFVVNSTEAIWRAELDVPIDVTWPEDRQIEHLFAHGRLVECNEVAARLHGYASTEDMIGLPIGRLLPADDPRNLAFLRGAIRAGYRVHEAESVEHAADGRPLYFLVSFVAEVKNGLIHGAWGASRDVTEQRAAETALFESERRFSDMADAAPVLIWRSGLDKGCNYFNDGWLEFTGRTLEQEYGSGWSEGVHPEDLERCLRTYEESFDRQLPFEMQYRLRHHSGQYRWMTDRGVPYFGQRDVFRGYIGACVDIHEQRLAYEALAAANDTKDQFLAALSHELRTPLTSVLLLAEELEGDANLPAPAREQLGLIRRNVELESRLIDDLLDLNRFARGLIELNSEPVDLHAVVHDCVAMVERECATRGLTLEVSTDAGKHHVEGDAARLKQVLLNLLSNALKFSRPGGRIWLRTLSRGEVFALEVHDGGLGIAPDQLDAIFGAFHQGGLGARHRFGGLGLGLAISKAIVEAHDGRIQALSEGLGRGAVLRLELPTLSMVPPALPVPEMEFRPSVRTLRILVVEDHAETLQTLARLLRRDGHHILTAGNCSEARAAHEREPIDLLVTDLGLPDGSGFSLARELRNGSSIPVIIMSGFGMEEDLRRSHEAGFSAHLVKPINLADLRASIETAVPAAQLAPA